MSLSTWLPSRLLTFAKPASFPRGSLVFIPSTERAGSGVFPAIRFDLLDDKKNEHPWLFWLQGGPWGVDPKRRTATICRDLYLTCDDVAGVTPSQAGTVLDVEIDLCTMGTFESWRQANGAILAGSQGTHIAATEDGVHPIPIDISTWLYDERALRLPTRLTFGGWRLKVSDGIDRTYTDVKFAVPSAS